MQHGILNQAEMTKMVKDFDEVQEDNIPAILQQIDRLDRLVPLLHEDIHGLVKKLEPVLTPENMYPTENAVVHDFSDGHIGASPVANRLWQFANGLDNLRESITIIRNRVEV